MTWAAFCLAPQEVASVEVPEAGDEGPAGEGVCHRLGKAELPDGPPADLHLVRGRGRSRRPDDGGVDPLEIFEPLVPEGTKDEETGPQYG